MWHKFTTGPNPGAVEVEITSLIGNGGFFTVPSVAVYKYVPSGNPCSATPFSNIVALDDDLGFATLLGGIIDPTAKVTLPCVSPNTTYYIQVVGADVDLFGFMFPGFTDNYYYNVDVPDLGSGTGRAPNDNLVNALPVDNVAPLDGQLTVGGTLTVNGHNRCAT